jgi:ribose transport system substrate-binding protein
MKTKLLSLALTAAIAVTAFAGCENIPAIPEPTEAPAASEKAATPPKIPEGKPYIAVIAKGFKHQFWQSVYAGAKDASAKYDVEITFDGPDSEDDIATQVAMMDSALRKKPDALALAALDTASLEAQVNRALAAQIPIIAFDTGVPDAPEGAVRSTARTNQEHAGALAAQEMFNESDISDLIEEATSEEPVVIGVLVQDTVTPAIVSRVNGFVDEFSHLAESIHPDAVEISGHRLWAQDCEEATIVRIDVDVVNGAAAEDMQSAALNLLESSERLKGVFCSSEPVANALLAATADGTDLDRANGEYSDVVVIGFDSGNVQQNAVRNNYFYGAVAQDAYMTGYLCVELAVKAINGEGLDETADAGSRFYNSANMDSPEIASLLY